MEQMLGWFRDGLLRPKITEVYSLERAGEALQQLKDRRAKGRIVLVMTWPASVSAPPPSSG